MTAPKPAVPSRAVQVVAPVGNVLQVHLQPYATRKLVASRQVDHRVARQPPLVVVGRELVSLVHQSAANPQARQLGQAVLRPQRCRAARGQSDAVAHVGTCRGVGQHLGVHEAGLARDRPARCDAALHFKLHALDALARGQHRVARVLWIGGGGVGQLQVKGRHGGQQALVQPFLLPAHFQLFAFRRRRGAVAPDQRARVGLERARVAGVHHAARAHFPAQRGAGLGLAEVGDGCGVGVFELVMAQAQQQGEVAQREAVLHKHTGVARIG